MTPREFIETHAEFTSGDFQSGTGLSPKEAHRVLNGLSQRGWIKASKKWSDPKIYEVVQ